MSAIRQIVFSLLVLAAAGWIALRWTPGAREFVEKHETVRALIEKVPGLAAPATRSPEAAGKPGAVAPPPGGAPGAGRGGTGAGGGGGARASLVVVRATTRGTINTRVSALGTGAALHSVTVLPAASGRLVGLPVTAGQEVRAGDVLAHLDATRETIALDKARLAHEDAQRSLDRTLALQKANSVSATQVQQAQLAVDNAALGVRSAEADLANRSVLAPIEGTIGIVQVSAGNEVSASTVIATIEDDSAILVNYWLPEALVGVIRVGDTAAAVPVARPAVSIPAVVVGIDNKVDSASGTYEVQARLENDAGDLRPGMSFTITMNFTGESYLAVDPLSILWGSDGAYVWRVTDGKAERVAIRIVQRNSESVLVAGDLAEGDEIVTEGLDGLMPGAAVTLSTGRPIPGAGAQKAAPPDEAAPRLDAGGLDANREAPGSVAAAPGGGGRAGVAVAQPAAEPDR